MVGFPSPEEKSTNIRRARAAAGACVPQSGSAFTQLCSEGGERLGEGRGSATAADLQQPCTRAGRSGSDTAQQKSEQGPHQLVVKDHR